MFKTFKPLNLQVRGATTQNDYLMPSSATFISMGKNKDNKDVLVYSTALSKDQVFKFYSELSGLRLPINAPCIAAVDFKEDSYNNRIVNVTFCK